MKGMSLSPGGGSTGVPVRLATTADIPALFTIRTSVVENRLDLLQLAERGVTPDSMSGLLGCDHSRTFVVDQPEGVSGFATAHAQSASVFAVFVAPAAQGRGYGRALLSACEEWLFAQGCETIWLTTGEDPGNRAHAFYRAAGWTLVGSAEHGDVRYEKRCPESA
jgi:GNAT superfamily N-acetyltransferase